MSYVLNTLELLKIDQSCITLDTHMSDMMINGVINPIEQH